MSVLQVCVDICMEARHLQRCDRQMPVNKPSQSPTENCVETLRFGSRLTSRPHTTTTGATKGETEAAAGDLPPHQGSVSLSDFSFLPLLVVKLPPSALLASTFDFSSSRILSSSAV